MKRRARDPRISDTLWEQMAALRQLVFQQMQDGLAATADLELTLPQSTALFQIAARAPLSVSALQAALKRSQSATSHLVTQLERKGLVARKADAADGRRSALHLTPRGQRLVRRVEAIRREGFDRVLGQLPPAVLRQLQDTMRAVLAALTEVQP